ncbi:hypothetical protein LZ32DRAFT_264479 [Colletotrichum eremochloae]|nr:hypothetical protein LZ32DRAFT_264479 [Colletotrichum eremochloae]
MIPIGAIVLLPLLASAQGVAFTGPDVSTKLNLSAPITLTWEIIRNEDWTELDLWWHGAFAGSSTFGYELEANMSMPRAGEQYVYEWNPASVREGLAKSTGKLSADRDYYFTAKLHPSNSTAGETVYSEKYKVEDKALVSGSASAAGSLWGLVLSSLAVSVALL